MSRRPPKSTPRPPRRMPWQAELRAALLFDLDVLRAQLERTNLATYDKELADGLDEIVAALEDARCWHCGCSQFNPCAGGCSWAAHDPPLCSACARAGLKAT